MVSWWLRAALAASTVLYSLAAVAQVTEFAIPTPNATPERIVAGPDGNLWFIELDGNRIGKITTAGIITEYDIPTFDSNPRGIAVGPDGALWFAEQVGNKIGRITTSGVVTEFAVPSPTSLPSSIVAGSDNALWFTERSANGKIGRVTTAGTFTEFPLPAGQSLREIAIGSDGNLWFTQDSTTNKIGRITTGGQISQINIPTPTANPIDLHVGTDGNIWVAEVGAKKLAQVTTAGGITEYPVANAPGAMTIGPDGALWTAEAGSHKIARLNYNGTVAQEFDLPITSFPSSLAAGADGAIWYAAEGSNKIGRLAISLPTGPSPLVASILPTSRSVQVGNLATVFASIINNSDTPLTNCRIEPLTYVNGYFSYQPTDSATNALSGPLNKAVNVSAHGLQSFVIAYRAGAPYPPTNVQFRFICAGVTAATAIPGVNTLQLVFDNSAVADMIAVGVTPSGDGFSRTGGPSGTGIFAVATTNIGPTTTLTAKPRLSDGSMPLTATVCETNASAQCKSPPAPTVTLSVPQNGIPTFSVFLTAAGAIAADPAKFRVFLEFIDTGSIVRGSTSTAVTTQ